jgi:hypothetical protein
MSPVGSMPIFAGCHSVVLTKQATEMRLAFEAVGEGDAPDAQARAHAVREGLGGLVQASRLDIFAHGVPPSFEQGVYIPATDSKRRGYGGDIQLLVSQVLLDEAVDLHAQGAGERGPLDTSGRNGRVCSGDDVQNRATQAAPRCGRDALLEREP